MNTTLDSATFMRIRDYVHCHAGILIGAEKSSMVVSRLWRRLELLGLPTFEQYLALVTSPEGAAERVHMLDHLTTNETYFFREPAHFNRLQQQILPSLPRRPLRVWCGAASTGEEPYSLAMVLQDTLGNQPWELVATDLSTKVLQQALRGIYRLERLEQMPPAYLKRYCRRGVEKYEGTLMIDTELRRKVEFREHNLLQPLEDRGGGFDVIFLRNVLIYFDQPTKQRVLDHVVAQLRPGGWLVTGHCDSLIGIRLPLQQIIPSVFVSAPAQHQPQKRPA
jgi:chemotaxis protein methyltransferase CheR